MQNKPRRSKTYIRSVMEASDGTFELSRDGKADLLSL